MVNVKETRDYVHSMVHRGSMHSVSTACTSLADGASIGLVVKNGATDDFHAGFAVAMSGNGRVRLYEDPTLTSSTLCTVACNMNRGAASSVGLAASFGYTPVFDVATASAIHDDVIAGGTGPGQTKVGSEARNNAEWILKKDTIYILAACNLSGGAVLASITVEGYKH